MTIIKWSAGETKSVVYAPGDTIATNIPAVYMELLLINGQWVFDAASRGTLTLRPATGTTLGLGQLFMSYADGGAFHYAGGATRVNGGGGGDFMLGSNLADVLYGSDGANYLEGMGGDDTLWTGDDPSLLDGGSGNDLLVGGAGNDGLFGGTGDDELQGGDGKDHAWGGDGADELYGGLGNDTLAGNAGADYLSGDEGDDKLTGGADDDDLRGGDGNDNLAGDAGDDYLSGGDGNDSLDGGAGHNLLAGGLGDDSYAVHSRGDYVVDKGGLDSGIVYADWYKAVAAVEHWTWAEGVQRLPYWIDALTHDYAPRNLVNLAAGGTLYYHFAQAPAGYFSDEDKQQFLAFTGEQIRYTRQALDYIATLLNLRFEETLSPDTPMSIVFGNNAQQNSSGYASMVYDGHGSPLMLDRDWRVMHPDNDGGAALYTVLMHELGHALGLKHPFGHPDADGDVGAGPYLGASEDQAGATVMSYTGDKLAHQDQYSGLDIAALQYLYGVAPGAHGGDSRYVLDAAAANLVWDGNGNDTLDGAGLSGNLTLRLDPGYWSYIGARADTITAAGQITINFGSVIETAIGGAGDDALTGNAAANVLSGGNGADTLTGGGGADTLHGGAGLDTAVYAGRYGGYSLAWNGGALTVSDLGGAEGSDTLDGVERLRFADGMVALDVGAQGVGGQLYRLYQAAFDRQPDSAGIGYWLAQADRGASMLSIADNFLHTAEFATLYGGAHPTDDAFVAKLYGNVLHRPYDPGGYAYWTGALAAGAARADVLLSFAASGENDQQVAPLIASGFAYAPYG